MITDTQRRWLSIGFFGQDAVNSFGRDGLFYGGGLGQLGRQFVGVGSQDTQHFVGLAYQAHYF